MTHRIRAVKPTTVTCITLIFGGRVNKQYDACYTHGDRQQT